MKFVKWVKKYTDILRGRGKPGRGLIRAAKGSVTIFLLVIMFPMLVFSFSVVDICKIFMAKDSIEAATDIALRSALTAYDDVLKDMYGIFATSKSDDELKESVLKYYESTLSSCGMTDEESSATMSFIQGLFDTGISEDMNKNENFLKVFPGATIDGTKKDSITLSGVKESAASNPTVLHRQIVEYMKYRGPVVMTAGLFEKINAFTDLGNQTKAASDRLEYEKTAAKLNNNAIMAYTLLQMYEDNNRVLEGGSSSISSLPYIEEKYKTGLIEKCKYAYNSSFPLADIKSKSSAKASIERSVDKLRTASNYILTIQDYLPGYFDSNPNANELTRIALSANNDDDYNLSANIKEAYDYITTEPQYSDLYKAIKDEKVSDYLGNLSNVCAGSEKAGSNANTAFLILKSFAPLYKSPSGKKPDETDLSKQLKKFIQIYEKIERDGGTPDGKYKELYEQITTTEEALESYVGAKYGDAEKKFNEASSELNMLYDAMTKQINVIDILTGESEIPYTVFGFEVGKGVSLWDIYNQFNKAKKDAATWGESIDKIQTTSQKNSNEAQYKSETDGIAELKEDDVNKMVNELKNQRAIYAGIAESLKSIVFLNGSRIIDATLDKNEHRKHTTFKEYFNNSDLSTISVSSAGTIETAAASQAAVPFTAFNGSVSPSKWTELAGKVTNNGENAFYKQLKKISQPAKDENDETVKEQKKNGEEIQSKIQDNGKVDDKGTPTATTGTEENPPEDDDSDDDYLKDIKLFKNFYNNDDTPSGGTAAEFKAEDMSGDNDELASNTQSLMKDIGDYFAKLAKSLGESVLVTEYINKQFSCYTTNMDGKGNRTEKETMLTGMSFYDTEKKKANVVWYGAEQEYILYGFDDKNANLAAAYAAIFAIRFVLNFIYSYTDTEIRNFTWSVASAIGGVFPLSIPLIQTVLHVALSMAESVYDMVLLRKGAEVPIYKTSETWMCKGTNIVRNIAADVIDKVTESVVDKVAGSLAEAINNANGKAIDFVNTKVDGFDELVDSELQKLETQIQTDIITPLESAVQKAMSEYDGQKEAFRKSLERLINNIYMDEDGSKIDYSRLGLDNIEEGNYLKKAEKAVLDHLINNKTTYVNIIVNKVDDYIKLATNVSAAEFDIDSYENLGNFADEFKKDMSGLFQNVNAEVKKVTGEVKKVLSDTLNELAKKAKDGVKVGADYVKEKVGEFSNKIRGQGHLDQNISFDSKKSTSSTINMSYKDYLNIFMIIAVATGDTNQLERAGKLMTANVRKQSGNKEYDLNTAHTVIKAESSATVRTVFFGSVLEDGSFKLSGNPNKYSFDYTTFLGY